MNLKVVFGILVFLMSVNAFATDHKIDTIKEIKALQEMYNISILTTEFSASDYAKRWSTWENIDNSDYQTLKKFMLVFFEEWTKYPLMWIEKNELKGIAFVQKLNVVGQNRFAMPDAYGEVLYYDIDYLKYGERYVRDCIHHEFYHMIEEANYRDMYYKDPKWMVMNPEGFAYGKGGSSAYNSDEYVAKEHPYEGFVSAYATYGLEEDKAEVYSYLFSTESYQFLIDWIKTDRVLLKKVNYLKSFISSIVPEMDEAYYSKIHFLKNEKNNSQTIEKGDVKTKLGREIKK